MSSRFCISNANIYVISINRSFTVPRFIPLSFFIILAGNSRDCSVTGKTNIMLRTKIWMCSLQLPHLSLCMTCNKIFAKSLTQRYNVHFIQLTNIKHSSYMLILKSEFIRFGTTSDTFKRIQEERLKWNPVFFNE